MLFKREPLLSSYYCILTDLVNDRVTPALADRATKQSRATAYRLIRHMLVSMQSVEKLGEHALDWYLVKYASILLQLSSL